LATGAIAGIAIGDAAVLLLALGLFLYWRRNSRKQEPMQQVPVPLGYNSAPPSHVSYLGGSHPHSSYMGQSPVTPSFIGPYRGSPKPPDELSAVAYEHSLGTSSPGPVVQRQIAEMDSQQGESTPVQSPRMPSPATQPLPSMGYEFSGPTYGRQA
jgi:hypothetical protein